MLYSQGVKTPHPFKAFRIKRHLTQQKVAALAEVTQSQISKGERNGFSATTAIRISDALGISLDVLLPRRRRTSALLADGAPE